MELITKKDVLKKLPEKFSYTYPLNEIFHDGTNSKSIIELLKAESQLTEERANEIIGNDSWTKMVCDECKKSVNAIVVLGEQPDYDSATTAVCGECLMNALGLLENHLKQ